MNKELKTGYYYTTSPNDEWKRVAFYESSLDKFIVEEGPNEGATFTLNELSYVGDKLMVPYNMIPKNYYKNLTGYR